MRSHSIQLLKTIPRFQYEALSWVPDLLKVKDTEQELNSEEEEDYEHEVIPVELDGIRYEEFASYRIGIFGDVGVGKSTLLQAFIQKKEPTNILATDGVNYEIYQRGKDGICNRFTFCDFSGQLRLRPIMQGIVGWR